MAHFARVRNGVVYQVIVIDQETLNLGHWGNPAEWIQASYNTRGGVHYGPDGQPDGGVALRKNFPGPGFSYDADRDAFIPPCMHPSWTLDEESCTWIPPIPYPNDGKVYKWDDQAQNWAEVMKEEK